MTWPLVFSRLGAAPAKPVATAATSRPRAIVRIVHTRFARLALMSALSWGELGLVHSKQRVFAIPRLLTGPKLLLDAAGDRRARQLGTDRALAVGAFAGRVHR